MQITNSSVIKFGSATITAIYYGLSLVYSASGGSSGLSLDFSKNTNSGYVAAIGV